MWDWVNDKPTNQNMSNNIQTYDWTNNQSNNVAQNDSNNTSWDWVNDKSETPQLTGNRWTDFVNVATPISQSENYPTDVMLAQAALETGHATSPISMRNNYFGYEAYNSNPDAAKAYGTAQDSVKDYINLIKNTPRYSWAYQKWLQDHNSEEFLRNIIRSGYAVSPGMDQETKAQEYTNNAFSALRGTN